MSPTRAVTEDQSRGDVWDTMSTKPGQQLSEAIIALLLCWKFSRGQLTLQHRLKLTPALPREHLWKTSMYSRIWSSTYMQRRVINA